MLKALVIDDHNEMRTWLATLVEEAFPGVEIKEGSSLMQARAKLATERFGLALIDISLPDGSGIELIHELTQQQPDCYPVITSIHDDDEHLFGALEAGAKGYLLKEQPRDSLLNALQGIVRGEPPLSPSIARRILRYFTRQGGQSPSPGPQPSLTAREHEVLRLLSRGYTRNDIALALAISPNTAAGYIKGIYRKLNVSGRAEAVMEAMQQGIIE